jgi:hypothetical protein
MVQHSSRAKFAIPHRWRLAPVAYALVFGTPRLATADTEAAEAPSVTGAPTTDADPSLRGEPKVSAIGALSVGHPHAGFLFNAVQLPESKFWVRTVPKQSYGTEETIRSIMHCIARVQELFPHSPPAMIGAISARSGGPLKPHKSHRTGRDADIYLYRTGGKWYRAATADDLDKARSWALLKAFATEADVDMILLDKKLQALLEAHALSIGEDPLWVEDLFHGRGRYPNPLVKHVPGHVAHMHVRFVSPVARERGRLAYDQLVELGHIDLPSKERRHVVERGDTLLGIARRHDTTLESIMKRNALEETTIYVGQSLIIEERQDLRDAHAPVVVPRRRLPSAERRPGTATVAQAESARTEAEPGSSEGTSGS